MSQLAPDHGSYGETSTNEWIACTKLSEGHVTGGNWNIYLTGLDGTPERQITHHPVAYEHAWSPDGRWIAFASYEKDGGHNLYVVAPDGTNRRQLTHDTEDDYRDATWGMPVRYNLAWRPRSSNAR